MRFPTLGSTLALTFYPESGEFLNATASFATISCPVCSADFFCYSVIAVKANT